MINWMLNRINNFVSKEIKKYLLSSTAKDSLILLSGNVVSNLLGFLVILILTRFLGVAHFGLFITALAFSQMVGDIAELGINSASLNFLSSSDQIDKIHFLKTSFISKTIVAIVCGLLVFILAKPISGFILQNDQIFPYIQISALGIIFFMFANWGQVVFQAERKFTWSVLVNFSINILRILALAVLLLLGIFTALSAYFSFQIVLLLTAALIFWQTGLTFLKSANNWGYFKKLFRFGLPVGLGFAVAALYTRLDQILIFNLVGEREAGVYGLAFKAAITLGIVSSALSSAITPRFASLSLADFPVYFKKTILAACFLGSLVLLVIPLAPIILPFIFGTNFLSSILPFQILGVGMIFFIVSSPFYSAILYRFKKSGFNFFSASLSLALTWWLLNLLIPIYQSWGAALAVALVYFSQLLLSIGYYLYLNKRG